MPKQGKGKHCIWKVSTVRGSKYVTVKLRVITYSDANPRVVEYQVYERIKVRTVPARAPDFPQERSLVHPR